MNFPEAFDERLRLLRREVEVCVNLPRGASFQVTRIALLIEQADYCFAELNRIEEQVRRNSTCIEAFDRLKLYAVRVLSCRQFDRNSDSRVTYLELLVAETKADGELATLRKFKEYVHQRLDALGIPVDPDPAKTTETGCRVGRRFDYLDAELAAIRADLLQVTETLVRLTTPRKVAILSPTR